MVTEGNCFSISAATSSSFDVVREAKMRVLGLCDAIAIAVAAPIEVGLTPVMTTRRYCQVNCLR